MSTHIKYVPTARRWLIAGLVLLLLFLIYTAFFSTGALLNLTLHAEQWLLHRPLTSIDCVFRQWKLLGDPPFTVFLTLVLGIVCLCLGYRQRMLPYLMLLLLLGVGIEAAGKQVFSQPVPNALGFGMNTLACPQLAREPRTVRVMVMLGMWWDAPSISQRAVRKEQFSATAPLTLSDSNSVNGYPSGHAMRWSFIGLVAAWLIWRHVKRRLLRRLLMALALIVAFTGGFAMFYIGLHLLTDLTAGYLLGASTACCAVALLMRNETRNRFALSGGPAPEPDRQGSQDEEGGIGNKSNRARTSHRPYNGR